MYNDSTDIDECHENTDGCGQICSNTIGSYVCGCNTGYRLATDRHTCSGTQHFLLQYSFVFCFILYNTNVDINECVEDTDGCVQNCNNTIGSYTCSCASGYRLASDRRGCTGRYLKAYNLSSRLTRPLSIGRRH